MGTNTCQKLFPGCPAAASYTHIHQTCSITSKTNKRMAKYVWYASYGSNILSKRFLCYLQGGRVEGMSHDCCGSTDKTLPRESRVIQIPHPLLFAKESGTWKGGVAFIDLDSNFEGKPTLGRMYLIQSHQFKHIVAQENGRQLDAFDELDLDEIDKRKCVASGWYGTIARIGECEGFPIFTFTSATRQQPKPPSPAYLRVIMHGLLESEHKMSKEQVVDYLLDAEGVVGLKKTDDWRQGWTYDMLMQLW